MDGRDDVELTCVIAAAFWGRIMPPKPPAPFEITPFATWASRRIVSLIDPANTASKRVALKLGMKFAASTLRPSGKTIESLRRLTALQTAAADL